MGQALVGREPILDRGLNVFGYELLFRPEEENSKPINVESATSLVVNNAFVDIGLDRVGGTRGFHQCHSGFSPRAFESHAPEEPGGPGSAGRRVDRRRANLGD